MRTLLVVVMVCLCTVALSASYDSHRATLGRIVYDLSCAVCHSTTGGGNLAGSLEVQAPNLALLQRRHGGVFPEEYVTRVINGGAAVTVHGGQMPAWGLIFLKDFEAQAGHSPASPQELVKRRIGDLVEYLKKIQVP